MEQFISAPLSNGGNTDELGNMLSWTGVVSDTESWYSALPLPAPYTFVYSSDYCSFVENVGVTERGMKWGPAKELVLPAENQEIPKTKEEVLSWFQEATSTSTKSSESKNKNSDAMVLSTIAIILSSIVLSIFAGIFALRVLQPDQFVQSLHPKMANHLSGKEAIQKSDML